MFQAYSNGQILCASGLIFAHQQKNFGLFHMTHNRIVIKWKPELITLHINMPIFFLLIIKLESNGINS